MLSIAPQDFQLQPQPYYYLPTSTSAYPRAVSSSSPQHHHRFPAVPQHQQSEIYFTFAPTLDTATTAAMAAAAATHSRPSQDSSVAQALEIARESPDGCSDPTISKILEAALSQIWSKVQAQPDSYIMTRDEFAVFNFFQHRFTGDKTAVGARKLYWDNCRA